MDLKSQTHQAKLKYLAETQLRVSQMDSLIQKYSERIKELNKSLGDTRTQIYDLDAELATHNNTLSDEIKGEEDIRTSNKGLSSHLVDILAELGLLENRLQALDDACYRKKFLFEKVSSTDITKLVEAEKQEIQKLTQESINLHDQVSDLLKKLKSGGVNLEKQRHKISRIKRDIRLCEQKLPLAKSNEQSYLLQLKSVTEMRETTRQSRGEIFKWKEILRNSANEKTSMSSSQPENQLNMTPLV